MKNFNHVGSELIDLPVEYVDGKRYYVTPKGNKYISITTLLSNLSKVAIQEWRERVGETKANKITRQASNRGTRVHSVCESYIQNQDGYLEGELPNVIEMFRSIEPLLDRIDNVRLVEGALWSDELKVAGRTDLIGDFDDELAVIDYKTSTYRKSWEMCHKFFMQGTFYAHAFEERTGTSIENIVIIMAVEGDDPILFRETKSRWFEPLKEVINKYN